MTKTNLSRFSSLAFACLVLLSAAAVPAAAVSVADTDVPSEAQVGTQVTATVTLDEPYRNPQLEQWTLAGETDLTDVTWTVVYYDQTGAKVSQESFDGQTFDGATVSEQDGTSEVEVRVRGTAPEIDEYSYDPPQSFAVLSLDQTRAGGSTTGIDTWRAHHYTAESDEARAALDDARDAIDAAEANGANVGEAEQSFRNAVDAYESANFDLTKTLASEAKTRADNARQSRQTRQLVVYAVVGLLIVGLLVGGFVWYQRNKQTYDKLG